MQPTVSELPGSRVSVEVEVPAADVDRAVSRAARTLAREMRMPGFRKGKAPPSLVIQRVGFDAVLDEAIREALPGWYERALLGSGIAPVGDPKVEVVSTPEGEGEPLAFKFEIGVRPKAELGDDFASEASEFDTLDELRADIAKRLAEAVGQRAEQDFRLAAIDAAAAEAKLDLPGELATARAGERWERFERQLAGQGMNPDAYLQMQGKTRDQVIEESVPEAEAELKREAVLAAIADAEGIEVSEEEMVEALAHPAEHERTTPEKLLKRLRESGRDTMIRDDIRYRKAIDLVAESAQPIPLEQAEAREQIWTPEKERKEAGSLWTPDSE
jgi:FKBP-type peptidyl-prolyl cis-trans isomerase (trigger factor)